MRLGILHALLLPTRMSFNEERLLMVNNQLRRRGIGDERVLQAMETVPRHLFVAPELASEAYHDHPLPIGDDQTISQPYIVASMAEAACIGPTDKVLEIGTGCGYSAAVLSHLANKVISAEIIPGLGLAAKKRLEELKYDNVEVLVEDGSAGFEQFAPFDAIIVTAGAPKIPSQLLSQMKVGGRMVIPVRMPLNVFFGIGEKLLRVTRTNEEEDGYNVEELGDVGFVPLKGKAGWQDI